MGDRPKRWKVLTSDQKRVRELQTAYNLCRATAMVLCNRGIELDAVPNFVNPRLSKLHDPMELAGMDKAVERIWQAVKKRERILIHGDFDTDGITSTALLMWVLRENGAEVDSYLPHRIDDGYGLSTESIQKGVEDHSLIITVDCGITSIEGAVYAKSRGIDLIVTDHHQPDESIPDAYAVVNPKLAPEQEHLQPLAGVGVCFKLCHAFLKYGREQNLGGWRPELREGMDLVALGTVADIVPLTGENRSLVRYGMKVLTAQRRPGIHALCEIAGVRDKLTTEDIAFRLAPRLNAAGRMGDAEDALELLQAQSVIEAHRQARKLDSYNRARQDHEEETYQAARSLIKGKDLLRYNSLVVSGTDWHRGVIGIVASRLAQEYNRPAIVLAGDGRGSLNGSGRSVPGVNLVRALDACRELLERFGGHPMAVGLALAEHQINAFTDAFSEAVHEICPETSAFLPIIQLEGHLELGELTDQFFYERELLQPFGHKNPAPVFQFSKVHCNKIMHAGPNNSRGTVFDDYGNRVNFIFFGRKPNEFPMGAWDIAGIPEINTYNGYSTPQIQILDVRSAIV